MRQNKGFSLVELMIVVAIIGILAAIAIPNFVAMQLKAKRAEVPSNVDGIKTAELAYDAAFDGYVEAPDYPGVATLSKQQQPWIELSATGFNTIGWKPDGDVRGTYQVETNGTTDITVTGQCDVDDDGTDIANYTATTSINATLNSEPNIY